MAAVEFSLRPCAPSADGPYRAAVAGLGSSPTPVAVGLTLMLAQLGAAAQGASAPETDPPPEPRFTPLVAGDARLHPVAPGDRELRGGVRLRFDSVEPQPVSGPAAVDRIVVEVARNHVPADGQSAVRVRVQLFDRSGQPMRGNTLATVEHSGGRLLLDGAGTDELGPRGLDADRSTPGVQLVVKDGVAELQLLAPAEAQDVRIRVSADGQLTEGVVSFVPELRSMIAVGLLEGIVSLRGKVTLNPARRGDGFEQEIESWARQFRGGKADLGARAMMALKGTIRGDLLLTASFDSDKATRARLLRDVKPDEQYPVYGDASLRQFDGRSSERLYVRLDKHKSYVLYGDFVTGDGFSQPLGQGEVASLKQRSLGAYNRSATGVRLHHEDERFSGNAFAFRDSLRQVVEEFVSQGSGPYALQHAGVLEGSEKLEVVVRDRNQPSRIVAVRPLMRLVDYSFEPFSGRIVLASFLPATDEYLNPVSLRIAYEMDQGGDPYWVGGIDGQARLGEHVEVGGSAVQDRNPLAPYRLLSGNASFKLDSRTALVVEVAQSQATINTNPANQQTRPGLVSASGEVEGLAARAELVHQGERLTARVAASRSSPVFINPSAPLTGGRDEAQVQAALKLSDTLKLYAEGQHSESRLPGGGQRQAAALGAQWQAHERVTLDASLRSRRETVGSQPEGIPAPFGSTRGLTGSIATGSAGGALGQTQALLDPATGLPIITQEGPPAAGSSLTPGTRLDAELLRLGIGYRATEKLRLGAEAEADIAGTERQRLALGVDYAVNARTRAYGRAEHQTGWVQFNGVSDTGRRSDSFTLGFESNVLRETQLFSEGRVRDSISGRDLQVASGVRQVWNVAEGLRASAALERMKVLAGTSPSGTGVALGLDIATNPLWRASTGLELRRSGDLPATLDDERFGTALWKLSFVGKLDRDWTVLARNYLLKTDYVGPARGDVLQNRAQVGLAFRDTDRNRVNALGKVELKHESDASNPGVGTLKSRALILSLVSDFHPRRSVWATGRAAAKWQRDVFEGGTPGSFRAQMLSGRLVYDITENWDIGAMAAVQLGQNGARQTAAGVEVGYLLKQNLWLSAGFNAAGFAGDADLAGYEYTRAGAYIRLRFKFDETLFKRGDREVNRSLDR
ncbi:MAG: hypothetical protein JNJ71_18975 [Rubrivivax sp.]|nr:hypothetical protein [Rubrivivax sp.]